MLPRRISVVLTLDVHRSRIPCTVEFYRVYVYVPRLLAAVIRSFLRGYQALVP